MSQNKRVISLITFLILSFSILWILNNTATGNDDIYYKIDKGLFYLKEVYETVSQNYVDELDPEELSKSAINGMLEEFDPYTVFYEDPGSENLRMITSGKYGGIGMEIGFQNGKVTVMSPMEDTPAQRAGIQSGDIITKIDDELVSELSIEDVSHKLRGKIGSEVTIEIERPMVEDPIVLTLTREEIIINDVTFAEFIEPGIAFIRLSRFSDKAGAELKEAIRNLKTEGNIEKVILDLRENPGGLLTAAVEIVDVFVEPDQLVVSTRGSHENETKFFTQEKAILPTEKLIVLINGYSASASEIVAGAIQDLDRGVLVGTRTFGKGLVQKVYPIDNVTQSYLKVTTAKYYVPSGRSIQREDYKKNKDVFMNLSDSVEYDKKIKFYTKNGRVVHGGGGIKPDFEISDEDTDRILMSLSARGYLFRFTVDYLSKHPDLKNGSILKVTDKMLSDFIKSIEEENIKIEIEGEKELNDFIKIADTKKYDADIKDLVSVALQKLEVQKRDMYQEKKEKIRQMLEAEFAQKLGGNSAKIRSTLSHDNQTKKALELLANSEIYNQTLAVK
jgi:carboxyl-terminal processing protease